MMRKGVEMLHAGLKQFKIFHDVTRHEFLEVIGPQMVKEYG